MKILAGTFLVLGSFFFVGCRSNHLVATENKVLAPDFIRKQGGRHIWIRPRTNSQPSAFSFRSW